MTQATRILIAEDDPPSRTLLAAVLKHGGFEVIEAVNGEEAVRLALEFQPDLAILDINMPIMKGTEAAAIIRRETTVPFMFLSALDQEDIVQKAVAQGALGYLVKPWNVPQLIPTVKAALERADELQRLRTAESNLATALAVGRETSMAVGILMERHRLTQEAAFEALRAAARKQRRKVVDVAVSLLTATEMLNALVVSGAKD